MLSSIKHITRCLARNEPPPQANPSEPVTLTERGLRRRKEKVRRENGHSPFSLHSPTYSIKQDTDACEEVTAKYSVVTASASAKPKL